MSDFDWDDIDKSTTQSGSSRTGRNTHAGRKVKKGAYKANGGLHIGLTLTCLLSVGTVSFLLSFLTKNIESRPAWLLALTFALPVAALMISSLLVEKETRAMTKNAGYGSRLLFAGACIVMAAIVGLFCKVTNIEAQGTQLIPDGTGWSDTVIVLDKSASMSINNNDSKATNAVKRLVDQMSEETNVGLLIDVGWEESNCGSDIVPLKQRVVPISALDAKQREAIKKMASMYMVNCSHFGRSFEVAYEMALPYAQNATSENPVSIIMVTDGDDITNEFRASKYIDQFVNAHIRVYYISMTPTKVDEVSNLAFGTGGKDIYVSDSDLLLNEMTKMIEQTKYKTVTFDALRDIDRSETAKWVTGVLLMLLGILIGISLTVMMSVSGQKRFQCILSPLMAIAAFVILAFGKYVIPQDWVREGIAFTLFGIVLMAKNYGAKIHTSPKQEQNPVADVSGW